MKQVRRQNTVELVVAVDNLGSVSFTEARRVNRTIAHPEGESRNTYLLDATRHWPRVPTCVNSHTSAGASYMAASEMQGAAEARGQQLAVLWRDGHSCR